MDIEVKVDICPKCGDFAQEISEKRRYCYLDGHKLIKSTLILEIRNNKLERVLVKE